VLSGNDPRAGCQTRHLPARQRPDDRPRGTRSGDVRRGSPRRCAAWRRAELPRDSREGRFPEGGGPV